MLTDSTDKKKLEDILEATSDQAHRAGEIIKHCRHIVNKQPIEKCSISLNELTKETIRFMELYAQDRNVPIQVTLEENLPPVVVDKVQIQQVLVNLVRNGLEAMEENNGQERKLIVTTSMSNGNGQDPNALVTVKDTGQGVQNDQLNKLFDPFFTTKENGMGMGLSISRTIIEAHGGKLWVDNQGSNETQFHFSIPITSN